MTSTLLGRALSRLKRRPAPAPSGNLDAAHNLIGMLRNRGWLPEAARFAKALGLPAPDAPDAVRSPGDTAIGVIRDTVISTLHFRELTTDEDKRRAVRNGVRIIDVETFSQCNRRCHYCSNSVLDRFYTNQFIDPEIYRQVLSDLASIEWDGTFRFVGLNEPTMHREHLLSCVRQAREALPKALLNVFTNGDYLDRDYLDALYDAGARALQISVHLQRGAPFDDDKIIKRIAMQAKRLKLDHHIHNHVPGQSVAGTIPYRDMLISIFQVDYEKLGHDRGGILEGIGRQDYVRTAACHVPIEMMVIAFNGNVMPCNHFVGDADQHKGLLVGQLGNGRSLFDIYGSPEHLAWRKALYAVGPKAAECRKCVDYADMPALSDPEVVGMAEKLDQLDEAGVRLFDGSVGGTPGIFLAS